MATATQRPSGTIRIPVLLRHFSSPLTTFLPHSLRKIHRDRNRYKVTQKTKNFFIFQLKEFFRNSSHCLTLWLSPPWLANGSVDGYNTSHHRRAQWRSSSNPLWLAKAREAWANQLKDPQGQYPFWYSLDIFLHIETGTK